MAVCRFTARVGTLREDMVWIRSGYGCRRDNGSPAGIDGKLRQVGEPMSDQGAIDSRRRATHQSANAVHDLQPRSLEEQVCVEELVDE